MFSGFIPLSVPKFGFGRTAAAGSAINIAPVEVHDVETGLDKRSRRLKHLLKLNHATYSILYNHLRFHNHTPHLLGSAYLLGCEADHLEEIYEDAAKNEGHDKWQDSPGEIALHDYRDFLGKREYQRAWVDFFEDQLVLRSYDWKAVVTKFVFEQGSKGSPHRLPMFNTLTAGLAHPLIHLGYAYELNSREVAMEALGLAATCYDPHLATLLDQANPTNSTANSWTYSTSNPFEIFARVVSDQRLDASFPQPGGGDLSKLLSTPALTSILLEHWNAWKITDPVSQFQQSQKLAVALLHATHAPTSKSPHYDFFLVHLLTSSHAVRILIPFLPAQYHLPLVREWFLITLAIYIAQGRPTVLLDPIQDIPFKDDDWDWIDKAAVAGKHRLDAHFVKAVRAMKAADKVWGPHAEDNFYGKAAAKFVKEFEGWGGFGADGAEAHGEKEEHGPLANLYSQTHLGQQ